MITLRARIIFIITCAFMLLLSKEASPLERVQFLMGTYVRIEVLDGTDEVIDKGFSVIRNLDELLSDYKPDSELSKVNRLAGGKSVEISDHMKEVIQISLAVARETGGAFDPTIGALTIGAYGFGRENFKIPSNDEINRAKALVDYNSVRLDGNNLSFEKEAMMLDLGGIGKGYAVDKAVDALRKMGIHEGSISISGDIRVFGIDQEIRIRHPRGDGFIATFKSGGRDLSISTSGDYERFAVEEGKVYHHILVPKKGISGNDFQSITIVLENNNTLADAYATALFALGRPGALSFLDGHPRIGAFIVFSDGEVFISNAFKELVKDLNIYM